MGAKVGDRRREITTIYLWTPDCHGRGRGFESPRPRHTHSKFALFPSARAALDEPSLRHALKAIWGSPFIPFLSGQRCVVSRMSA